MRLIIAGSRGLGETDLCLALIQFNIPGILRPTLVISGAAIGIDTADKRWAIRSGTPFLAYPADWKRFGRAAGYKRNEQMAENADCLLAVWDGVSRGTKHMIDIMKRAGKPMYLYIPKKT